MKLAMSPTRESFPLSQKKIYKKTLTGTFGWAILFVVIYAITFFSLMGIGGHAARYLPIITITIIGFLSIIVILTFLYQKWYFSVYFYDLTHDYITIRKNPITPKEITIPYERVQDVYMDQDLLDRFFGLYDVHLSSATLSSGMEAKIDGVEKEAADGLRALLLQKVHERISKKDPVSPGAPPQKG